MHSKFCTLYSAGKIQKTHVSSCEITWKTRHLACARNLYGLTRFFMQMGWGEVDYILTVYSENNSTFFNVQRPPHAHMKVMYTFHLGSKLSKIWSTSQMAWFSRDFTWAHVISRENHVMRDKKFTWFHVNFAWFHVSSRDFTWNHVSFLNFPSTVDKEATNHFFWARTNYECCIYLRHSD